MDFLKNFITLSILSIDTFLVGAMFSFQLVKSNCSLMSASIFFELQNNFHI